MSQSCVVSLLYRVPNKSELCCCDFLNQKLLNICFWTAPKNRDSEVGVATRYWLDGLGIEFRWGGGSAPVQTGPGAYPDSYTMSTGSFPGVIADGAWRWPSTSSSVEVKERVGFFALSGPSWPVVGRTLLPLTLLVFCLLFHQKSSSCSKRVVFCTKSVK